MRFTGRALALAFVLAGGSASAKVIGFQACKGLFAFCGASSCTPTNQTINVNIPGTRGKTAPFPEADCKCPVLNGIAIADVKFGNMQGSCTAGLSGGQVYSLFQYEPNLPQQINNWATSPASATAVVAQQCPATALQGSNQSNCFAFKCDAPTMINGVSVANCHCAMGESLLGQSTPPATGFLTAYGQGAAGSCGTSEAPTYPVGGASPADTNN
ncbi:MAG TPA: hypothetical protein VMB71_11615 [Acetobacteraceae bacterium]|nr:hypothetical protein [Acetobacteraceae bacterium]